MLKNHKKLSEGEKWRMKKVYIWGTGKYGRKVLPAVRTEYCSIEGFIDNDPSKYGKVYSGIEIVPFREIMDDYDYIVISVVKYHGILYQLKKEKDIDLSKVIIFFDESYYENPQYGNILDELKWRIILLEEKVERLERTLEFRFNNIGYEIIDKYRKEGYQYPRIGDTEEAVNKIVKERCSFVRFGDGEFEIMAGKEGPIFQKYSHNLAKRLLEVISSEEDRLLIGIANNYGNLDVYDEEIADGIRSYMRDEIREFHRSVLQKDRVYYDAYMFKSYFPYKNRKDTWKRVHMVKRIWDKRDILIVEGDKTRTGCGNDLFDNAKTIKRVLAPTQNAFDKYDEILHAILRIDKSSLILVILGSAAKPLVYDLTRKGYQAVDVGQIDMDYEWYLAGEGHKVPISNKYVSQLPPAEIFDVTDEQYRNQIIMQIK